MGRPARWLLLALVLGTAMGCEEPPPFAPDRDAGMAPICERTTDGFTCIGDVAWECVDGRARRSIDCAADDQVCVERTGCTVCRGSSVRCSGDTIEICVPDGSGWTSGATCDVASGLRCSPDGCVDLCARAAADRSYIGCEYFPVVTRNSALAPEFSYALAIANPQLVPAVVQVDRAGTILAERTISPGALEIVRLPWVEQLRSPGGDASVLVPDGAYYVRSDVPVVVSQFDPLEYRLPSDCAHEEGSSASDRQCFSYTNDASLLLPLHVLTGSYLVAARPSHRLLRDGMPSGAPGFVSIVGAADDVQVEVRTTAHVGASVDGTIAAMAPGERRSFTLSRGDVLQLASAGVPHPCPGPTRTETVGSSTLEYCDPGAAYDLTGTEIHANGPVAVFSGHDCTFVPYDRWACDHLEEQLFPVESLGTSAFVAATHPLRRNEPNLLRVVSAADANTITFTPPLVAPVTLDRGRWVELEMRQGVRLEGTGPLLAVTYLVGQDYGGLGTAGARGVGDPAMALAIPDAQYRNDYTFLSPDTFEQSWVDVIAPTGARVVIDRTLVSNWTPIEGTDWSTASVRLSPGVHRATAARPFGLQVYGFGAYSSYLVPGGLDLRRIGAPF